MSLDKASAGHLAGLDGSRALAVIAVVWHHAHPGFAWLPMSYKGFLGVDAFFVLSGFLITTLLLREQSARGSISLKNFYIRRSLRIFPLYYALLAALAVYFLFAEGSSLSGGFLKALPYHAAYVSNWVHVDQLMAITWSLSTEEQFYLLWPPLLVLLGARAAMVLLLLFLALNQAVNFGWLDGVLATAGLRYESHDILQTTFTPIILGVLLSFAMQAPPSRQWLEKTMTPRALTVLAFLLLALLNWPGAVRGWPRLGVHVLITLMLCAIVLRPRHALVRCLQWRPLAYLGAISYGIYLLHKLGLVVASRLLQRLSLESPELLFALGLLITIGIAGLSFRYFENPLLRLKDLFRSNAGTSPPAPAATRIGAELPNNKKP